MTTVHTEEHPYVGVGLMGLAIGGGVADLFTFPRMSTPTAVALGAADGAVYGVGSAQVKKLDGQEDTTVKDAATDAALGAGAMGFLKGLQALTKNISGVPGERIFRHVDLFVAKHGVWIGGRW